jgi:protoporphyrinogen oxidase
MAKIGIIGAGIAGLSVGNMLQKHGHTVVLFEKSNVIGGLVSCTSISGSLFHRVGGHVFNTKDEEVFEWFMSFFDIEADFTKAQRFAAIYLNRSFIPYPLELNLRHLPGRTLNQVIKELAFLASSPQPICPLSDFGSFLRSNFGDTLYQLYFYPYNRKIWGTEPDLISLDWLKGKFPMSSPLKILEQNILDSKADSMPHSEFFYPKQGGSQFIADKLSSNLNIVFREVQEISPLDDGGILLDGSRFDAVVFTGNATSIPIMLNLEALSLCPAFERDLKGVLNLQSNPTTVAFCECDSNPYSWLYLPSPSTPFHRMIMTGNFSVANNSASLSPGRITCTVESIGALSRKVILDHLEQLPFAPKLLDVHYSPFSYVLHDHESRDLMQRFIPKLYDYNLFLCGRFAEWEYYNMDAAIRSAMNVVEKIHHKY